MFELMKTSSEWSTYRIYRLVFVLMLIVTSIGLFCMSGFGMKFSPWSMMPTMHGFKQYGGEPTIPSTNGLEIDGFEFRPSIQANPCSSPVHWPLNVSLQSKTMLGHPPYCNTTAVCGDKDYVVKVNLTAPTWYTLNARIKTNFIGGHFRPLSCLPQYRVAIVIPYRNREKQLLTFLQHIHPFLQRQSIEYRIFVIELSEEITFNRGMLMNIGFTEATKYNRFNCFIFHDVDLLPENARNLYVCDERYARHLSVAVNKFQYKLPYQTLVGGALALKKHMLIQLNGFSNKYFGWGGEDDDMYIRLTNSNINVTRYSENISRYAMIKHAQETPSPLEMRKRLLDGSKSRHRTDGLSTLKYKVLNRDVKPLYTWVHVTVDPRDYNCTEKDNCTPVKKSAKRLKRQQPTTENIVVKHLRSKLPEFLSRTF